MANLYCLQYPWYISSRIFCKGIFAHKEILSITTTDGQIISNSVKDCCSDHSKAGIVIGGYFIREANTDLLEEPAIRY
jgi:hypothetical protein